MLYIMITCLYNILDLWKTSYLRWTGKIRMVAQLLKDCKSQGKV